MSLTLATLFSLVTAVVTCVVGANSFYYQKIDKRFSNLESIVGSGVVTQGDQEKWVLKARAANAVKYPDLVWPSVKETKDPESRLNAPLAIATTQ